MYVAFEGIDTVGKSTQVARVARAFDNVLVTKEPGGTPLGRKIRTILLEEGDLHPRSEVLLFLADRAEHTERVIRPNHDRLILSDRSFISGVAYAHVHEKIAIDTLLQLNRYATANLVPDAVVLMTIDEESLLKRLSDKKHDTIEKRGIEYMMAVQRCMEELTDLLEIDRLVVDATQSVDTITRLITQFIKERL
ncbi:dTMP kinase [Hydrogenimonas urashimensis]|uniref:dTMP kinase n=1 Tax=Hydrogenimonas urashimensis TaxID=2740515 RepID=UPI0019154A1B|nr:dTMP kinase [Hydrogenimonas urashimensis]